MLKKHVSYEDYCKAVRLNLQQRNRVDGKNKGNGIAKVAKGDFKGSVGYYDDEFGLLWTEFPYMTTGMPVTKSQLGHCSPRQLQDYTTLYANEESFLNMVKASQAAVRARAIRRQEGLEEE